MTNSECQSYFSLYLFVILDVRNLKLYILFALLLVVSSCRKDDKIPFCEQFPNDCSQIIGVKDYFDFKEESWWVYEQESSLERESIYVTLNSSHYSSYRFRTETFSTHQQYHLNYWSSTGIIDSGLIEKEGSGVNVKISKTNPGDFVSESSCFIYYPEKGKSGYTDGGQPHGYGNVLMVDKLEVNFTMDTMFFENVVVMTEEHTASEHSQPTIKHYAENVGLIKKELLDSNQVWNLVDYNIVK